MTKNPPKSLYLLPNAFTIASIFCGFLAMILAFKAQGDVSEFYSAGLLVALSMIFDGMDGRVARMTNTQSEFGVQLDSLADAVAFGVAPAAIIYEWALADMGFIGVFSAFAFIACGITRLARFNVEANQASKEGSEGPSQYFTGIPIPTAAGVMASVVLSATTFGISPTGLEWPIIGLMGLMSFLMVSTVKFPTFKKVNYNARTKAILVVSVSAITVVSVVWSFFLAANITLMLYIAAGLAKSFTSKIRRQATRHQS